MGKELRCTARHAGQTALGKAMLETDDLRFHGEFDVTILRRDIRNVSVRHGVLAVAHPGGVLELDLGRPAQTWAEQLLNPPSRLDKLGIRGGMRVRLQGDLPADFVAELGTSGAQVLQAEGPADLAFLRVVDLPDLQALEGLRQAIAPDGGIWAVWTKGRKALGESHVRQAALQAGLVDVKVCRFDDALSALKLVIRRADRAR